MCNIVKMGLLLLCALKDDVALDRFVAKKKVDIKQKLLFTVSFMIWKVPVVSEMFHKKKLVDCDSLI